jgi:glycosyltransferase involved in cell wall biosynthesis
MSRSGEITVCHLLVGLTRGGAERLLVEVLPHLPAQGVQPTVVALKEWGPVGEDLRARGIEVDALGGQGRGDPRPVLRLVSHLRRRRPAVLHAHLARAVMAGWWAARSAGVPVVTHFHSLAGGRPAWQDRLEGAAARRARARVAVSAAVAADRANRFRLPTDAFQVIHNGIDTGRFASLPEPSTDRPVFGYLGRLTAREKGLDTLLAAAERLEQSGVAWPAMEIAGGPPEAAAELRRRAARSGLENRVRVLGETADVTVVLARWSALVMPSRAEGFGLALVEAMAAGRPVVACRSGGIPEVVEDGATGILVPPEDPEALAEAMARLAADPAGMVRLGVSARRLARTRFDARETAASWARVARAAAAEGGRP